MLRHSKHLNVTQKERVDDGDDIVYHNYFDVSIAVSAPEAVTPVLKDTDALGMADIEKGIKALAIKGRWQVVIRRTTRR